MPSVLAKTNKKGVPVVSILVAAVVGCVAFGPFKSWKDLVEVVTGTTAIMYGVRAGVARRAAQARPRSTRARTACRCRRSCCRRRSARRT